jgi:hypothetical protein
VRKSLLSALIGNAVERKEIDLSQTIGALGIDYNEPSLTAEEKSATVRDLLQARSGVYHAALYETRAAAALRPARHSHMPGTFRYYNNWDFNTLGTIYERAVRSSIFDAFEREIARPIGMQDYQPGDGAYATGAASIYPAYPIRMSARDLARFALLYLNKGPWRDGQIVPAAWVDESTRPYSHSMVSRMVMFQPLMRAVHDFQRGDGEGNRSHQLRDRHIGTCDVALKHECDLRFDARRYESVAFDAFSAARVGEQRPIVRFIHTQLLLQRPLMSNQFCGQSGGAHACANGRHSIFERRRRCLSCQGPIHARAGRWV